MSEFLQQVAAEIQNRKLFSRGQKILVAVSGGVDSMVLLQALHSLAPSNHWQLAVAHFNHRLRGRASDADEKLVRKTAGALRLKCVVGRGDVKAFAARSKISIEMAARKLRHEFLARMAREQKISAIALAHHADDQVELFFLRLLRGAGGEGLAGMKWRSPSPVRKDISLVRPLLNVSKTELLAFADEHKIGFRDDATNFSTDFLRNRIRQELLPLLRRKYQPAVDKTVLRLMDIVGAETEWVAAAARTWECGHLARGRAALPTEEFAGLPLAVQRKVLQRQLGGLGLLSEFDLIEELRRCAGKRVNVAAGVAVARDAAGKVQMQDLSRLPQFGAGECMLNVARAGEGEFAGRKFRWRLQTQRKSTPWKKRPAAQAVRREAFDADRVGAEIILRHWRPGDRFQPIGMKTPVKLQDLFVNAKVPAARRRELVLATTAAGEIFWVEDLRIGENFKLTPVTRRRLMWSWGAR